MNVEKIKGPKFINNNIKKPNFSKPNYNEYDRQRSKSKSPGKDNLNNVNFYKNKSKQVLQEQLIRNPPSKDLFYYTPNVLSPQNINHKNQENSETDQPQSNQRSYDFGNLCFNVNDDWKTLVQKNSKLRQLVIQASDKVQELKIDAEKNEIRYEKEKGLIYEELERISKTYKIYADSHKKLQQQGEFHNKTKNESEYKQTLISSYQDHISIFIIDYITMFHKIIHHLTNYKPLNSTQFLCEIKNSMLENLGKFKGLIDHYNFPEVYQEYSNIINNVNHFASVKPKDNTSSINKINLPSESNKSDKGTKSINDYSPTRKNYIVNTINNKNIGNNTKVYNYSRSKSKDTSPSRLLDNNKFANYSTNIKVKNTISSSKPAVNNYSFTPNNVEKLSNISKENVVISQDPRVFEFLEKKAKELSIIDEINQKSSYQKDKSNFKPKTESNKYEEVNYTNNHDNLNNVPSNLNQNINK